MCRIATGGAFIYSTMRSKSWSGTHCRCQRRLMSPISSGGVSTLATRSQRRPLFRRRPISCSSTRTRSTVFARPSALLGTGLGVRQPRRIASWSSSSYGKVMGAMPSRRKIQALGRSPRAPTRGRTRLASRRRTSRPPYRRHRPPRPPQPRGLRTPRRPGSRRHPKRRCRKRRRRQRQFRPRRQRRSRRRRWRKRRRRRR
mmetsp:Transcript_52970/g.152589  ORF Transcript_52970/g.152589 Transcript_52970/m.152589 type:complete len:200 (+) Transcript_52970:397-996(+)